MDFYAVAIDGPAGSGKSTVAKILAERLGIIYVDTGAMYRAVALFCIRNGLKTTDESAVVGCISKIRLDITQVGAEQRIYLNDEDVSGKIRTHEVGQGASDVAVFLPVRERLVELQRSIAKKTSVIMDGRDIGTNVLPDAAVKIYLNASVIERSRRRMADYVALDKNTDLETVIEQIKARDYNDMNRKHNPLRKADDAIELDTTGMNIDEVTDKIIEIIKGKTGVE